jgi:hypothetical protein
VEFTTFGFHRLFQVIPPRPIHLWFHAVFKPSSSKLSYL